MTAANSGGTATLYLYQSEVLLENTIVTKNAAPGTLYRPWITYGVGVLSFSSNTTIYKCSIYNNTSSDILCEGSGSVTGTPSTYAVHSTHLL